MLLEVGNKSVPELLDSQQKEINTHTQGSDNLLKKKVQKNPNLPTL